MVSPFLPGKNRIVGLKIVDVGRSLLFFRILHHAREWGVEK
ncbi:hypothetical protein [Oscillatoria sp. FACHB-1407]|nr:hypothetical protein [Oscillatoria sp. FACHB-1407]